MNIKYYFQSIYKRKDSKSNSKAMKTIDKSTLKDIKSITLNTENVESFSIPSHLILDADFIILDKRNKDDDYRTQSGYIKFANEAADIIEGKSDEDSDQCTLGERLLGYCDVCVLDILFNDGSSFCIQLPYNPLTESMHGAEIELSNCPSIEFDENNDLVLCFGEKSKQFKRIDNNYSDLILGWKEKFGDACPDIIKGRLDGLSSFGNDFEQKFDISFKSCNLPGKAIRLRFINVTQCDLDLTFDQAYCELRMSRTSTGKIYVDIEGTLTFFCSCIYVYGYDFEQNKRIAGKHFDDDIFFKALYFTISEDVLQDFAYSKHYPRNASVYVDHERIKRAFESYLDGSLTREFLHHWIYFYKSMIDACDFHNELFKKIYAILDILYYSLTYKLNDAIAEKFVRKSYDKLKSIIG